MHRPVDEAIRDCEYVGVSSCVHLVYLEHPGEGNSAMI